MYCQNCGSALNPQTKYCNRCGTNLVPAGEKRLEKTAAEKRLDEYLDGLFWISCIWPGVYLGGAVLLKKVHFSDIVLLIYVVLSSTVFLNKFWVQLVGCAEPHAKFEGRQTHDAAGTRDSRANPAEDRTGDDAGEEV